MLPGARDASEALRKRYVLAARRSFCFFDFLDICAQVLHVDPSEGEQRDGVNDRPLNASSVFANSNDDQVIIPT